MVSDESLNQNSPTGLVALYQTINNSLVETEVYNPKEGFNNTIILEIAAKLRDQLPHLPLSIYTNQKNESVKPIEVRTQLFIPALFIDRSIELGSDEEAKEILLGAFVEAYEAYQKQEKFAVVRDYVSAIRSAVPAIKDPTTIPSPNQIKFIQDRIAQYMEGGSDLSNLLTLSKIDDLFGFLREQPIRASFRMQTVMYGWQYNWEWSRAPFETIQVHAVDSIPMLGNLITYADLNLRKLVVATNVSRPYNFTRHGKVIFSLVMPDIGRKFEMLLLVSGSDYELSDYRKSTHYIQIDHGYKVDDLWRSGPSNGPLLRAFNTGLYMKKLSEEEESVTGRDPEP